MKKLLITTLFIPFGLYAQEGFQQEIINQEALTPAFRYEIATCRSTQRRIKITWRIPSDRIKTINYLHMKI
jgi:hypothetical protein